MLMILFILVLFQMGNDTLNLDDEYMTGDEMEAYEENQENQDEEIQENQDQGNQDQENQDSLASTAEKSTRRKRSKCWKTFACIGTANGLSTYRCRLCEHVYHINVRKSGTNTLLRHTRVCTKTPGGTPNTGNKKLDMMVFREMIGLAIIEHDLPFSFVEYRRIREAFLYANSSIEFWSRNTAAADCLKIYEKEKLKLRKIIDQVPGRFCLTTDLWRSLTIEGYMCLTAHYIDSSWNLRAKILSFCAFPPPHTGASIATKVLALLKPSTLI